MNQLQMDFYVFILKMALEYRLSLENLCIILGIEAHEENQKEIYNIFDELFGKNTDLKLLYDFLFKCETIKENEATSLDALNSGYLFFYKYKIAHKNRDNSKIQEIENELNSLDNRINLLKNRDVNMELTDEDYLDIFKYKLKYCLSRSELSKLLNISSSELIRKELQLNDKKLIQKLNTLNQNQLDIVFSRTPSFDAQNILNINIVDYDNKLMEMCYKK